MNEAFQKARSADSHLSTTSLGKHAPHAPSAQGRRCLALVPGTTITIVLRAPNGVTNGTIVHFNGTTWDKVPTDNGGLPDLYANTVGSQISLGDLLHHPGAAQRRVGDDRRLAGNDDRSF